MSCQHKRVSRLVSSSRDEKDVWDEVARKWRHICMQTEVKRRVCDDCGTELSKSEQTKGC